MHDTKTTRCNALAWNDANASRLLDWQPGDAEAAAAIDGMGETYGSPSVGHSCHDESGRLITTWLAGEWVQATTPDGESRRVLIIEVLTEAGEDSEYHVACHVPGKGRQHWAIRNRDITGF